MFAEVAVSGPVARSSAFATGWATTRIAILSPPSRLSKVSFAGSTKLENPLEMKPIVPESHRLTQPG